MCDPEVAEVVQRGGSTRAQPHEPPLAPRPPDGERRADGEAREHGHSRDAHRPRPQLGEGGLRGVLREVLRERERPRVVARRICPSRVVDGVGEHVDGGEDERGEAEQLVQLDAIVERPHLELARVAQAGERHADHRQQ